MNDTEKPKFAQSMAAIGEIYGREISEVMVGIYWNALKIYENAEVQKAFQGHTRDTDNGQFFPKPADLIRHIEGSKDGRALLAWSKPMGKHTMRQRQSSIVAVMENSIFKVSHRTKPKPPIPASEIPTYDAIYPLLAKRWLRLRSRKNA
ncbi:hypothetical protein ACS77P_00230 [Yersinia enterocolitica]|uniref:hypothetical protein n=1 Tax=Yersinia enterocolitica TaxID=630 RepID=UPI003F42E313